MSRIQQQVGRALGIGRGSFTPVEQDSQVLHAVQLTRSGGFLVPCLSLSKVARDAPSH